MSGWGATNGKLHTISWVFHFLTFIVEYGGAGPSSSLFYITLSTIDNTECKKTYGEDTIRDEMVCAVSTGNVLQATCFVRMLILSHVLLYALKIYLGR